MTEEQAAALYQADDPCDGCRHYGLDGDEKPCRVCSAQGEHLLTSRFQRIVASNERNDTFQPKAENCEASEINQLVNISHRWVSTCAP